MSPHERPPIARLMDLCLAGGRPNTLPVVELSALRGCVRVGLCRSASVCLYLLGLLRGGHPLLFHVLNATRFYSYSIPLLGGVIHQTYHIHHIFSVVGPSAWNDLPFELHSLLMAHPSKFYISRKSFFFVRDWAGSASE